MAASAKTGVLLINLGTPSAPTTPAVRAYLDEFLSDPRVVRIPRLIWWLILHLVVLRLRPARSAEAYRKIWYPQGSPLLVHMTAVRDALRSALNDTAGETCVVEMGMRYGQPSIAGALETVRQTAGLEQILILPLYPQYSAATAASSFDAVARTLGNWTYIPTVRYVCDYHRHPLYIKALAKAVRQYWDKHGSREFLLFSFHGLPERSIRDGDPYHDQCHVTARLLAEELDLASDRWEIVFQSRFGRAEWLKPYCVEELGRLPSAGINRVDVFCPGFSVDCLETLEEIAMANKQVFMDAGGEQYRYIPALNDAPGQIEMLCSLVSENR